MRKGSFFRAVSHLSQSWRGIRAVLRLLGEMGQCHGDMIQNNDVERRAEKLYGNYLSSCFLPLHADLHWQDYSLPDNNQPCWHAFTLPEVRRGDERNILACSGGLAGKGEALNSRYPVYKLISHGIYSPERSENREEKIRIISVFKNGNNHASPAT